ncbi:MAG TPA: MFS transporter [Candidatus Cybelea sp.]
MKARVTQGGVLGDIETASWLPLVIVMLCQVQLSFNAFNVSISGITHDLNIPATSVGTALTTGTFAMACFILVGAKIGAKIGIRRAFQIGVVIPAISAAVIAVAVNGPMLFVAQAVSGASVALSAPALTVLIASNYRGRQQAQAVGFLASAIPLAQVVSLLIAGYLASTVGWRWSFWLLAAIGVVNFTASWLLKPLPPQHDLAIDVRGAILSSIAILCISFGFSGLESWGALLATPSAPFNVLGVSPVPLLLILGVIFAQAFFAWTRRRMDAGQPALFSLEVLNTSQKRATVWCMAMMLFVGTATSFLLPLYMQVVQGLSGFSTSLSIVPYTLSIFVANTLVVRLYDRFTPSQIARTAFIVVAAALMLLAFAIRNDWSQFVIVIGLVTLGLAQGCIVALVFNTLLGASPKELAGDVGAWRGLTHNVSGSVGIAVGNTVAVFVLATLISSNLSGNTIITPGLQSQLNFDNVNFITNDQLSAVLSKRAATPEQISEAVRINSEVRLRALRTTLLLLGALALLAIVPAGRMPGRAPPGA